MTDVKEIAKEAYIEGWKKGENTEEMSTLALRTANAQFERWWFTNKQGEIKTNESESWQDDGYDEDEDPHANPEYAMKWPVTD